MSKDKPVFCVMGAGHGGLAMAGHLALKGFEVRLYNRTDARLEAVRAMGGVEITSVEGVALGPIAAASSDAGPLLDGADIVMVVVPATGHAFIAQQCAPHLKDGQLVVLNPGRTFGALEFRQTLRRCGCGAAVRIAETQTFIYASRVIGPAQARIFGVKNSIPVATISAHQIPESLALLRKAYPQFIPGDNTLKTSFNNIGAVFHPAIMLLNTGWVEDPTDFEFYFQGVTSSVARVLEAADAERVAVAAALGIQAFSAREWLYLSYDAVGRSIHAAIHANPGYRGILAPHVMEMRYLTEEIPCSLVPMSSVGRKFGVATPVMDSLIGLGSVMHERDYTAEGRTLESLGLAQLSLQQLRRLAIGEEVE
jgi:opine dehydrogenase